MRRRDLRTNSGFTIIELMMVVAIVGVLALIALPSMQNLILTNRMKSVSLDLYSSLTLTRSEAIKRNSNNVSMVANSGGWQNGWKVCFDSNANGACDSGEPLLIEGEAVDASISLSGPGSNIVTYNRDGRVPTSSAGAAFRITAGANNTQAPMRCVDVDASGRPRTRVDRNGTDSDGCS